MSRTRLCLAALFAAALAFGGWVEAMEIAIPSPFGTYRISIPDPPVGPRDNVQFYNAIRPALPAPPAIFTAPLPTGSGARALGLAGAFTAIADDATAASWNPGGLVQLERPEISAVGMGTWRREDFSGGRDDFSLSDSAFDSGALNYASGVLPFRAAGRNLVFSLNYQQVFDFQQEFDLRAVSSSAAPVDLAQEYRYSDSIVRHYDDGITRAETRFDLETKENVLTRGLTDYATVQDVSFRQDGAVYALSPATAFEITPRLSVGAAVNVFTDDPFRGRAFRSITRSLYSGSSTFRGTIETRTATSGNYTYSGRIKVPGTDIVVPISGSGTFPETRAESRETYESELVFDGDYRRENVLDGVSGVNGTLGVLWLVDSRWSLGVCLDLPYSLDGDQTTTTVSEVEIRDAATGEVLGRSEEREEAVQEVSYRFPLTWSAGGACRLSEALTASLDLSQTLWSRYKLILEDGTQINPLNGEAYGEDGVEDTFAVRLGGEYLLIAPGTEVPFRGGLFWEQRPALGAPDDYVGFSLGSGFSLGRDPGKLIFDLAYVFSYGANALDNVFGPDADVRGKVIESKILGSLIFHF